MPDKEKREAAKAALDDQRKKRKAHVLSITAVIPGGGKASRPDGQLRRKGRRKEKRAQVKKAVGGAAKRLASAELGGRDYEAPVRTASSDEPKSVKAPKKKAVRK